MADKTTSHWPLTWTNCVSALLNIALPLFLARLLTADEMGRYRVYFLYVTLAPAVFMVAGFRSGLYYWVGRYPEGQSAVRQSWTLQTLVSFVFCAVGLALIPWLSQWIKIAPTDLCFLFLSIPLLISASFMEDLIIARGRIWAGSWYSAGFNAFRAISLLAAAWWTGSVQAMFWMFIVGCFLRVIVGWWMVAGSGELVWLFSRDKAMEVLRYALPVSLAALSALALQNMDQMILSIHLSPEKFAFYSIGCLMLPPLSIFEISVNRVLIPKLSHAFANNDLKHAASIFSQGISELFRFLMPASVGLIIFAEPIIEILFTSRYLAAAEYLRFYALMYLFLALPYDTTARARGDGKWILRTTLIFAPVSIAAVWWGTKHWDAMGALIALLVIQLSIRLYSLTYQRRSFASPFRTFLPFKQIGIETTIACLAAAGCFAMRPLFIDSKTWFFVAGTLFTVVYFAGVSIAAMRGSVDSGSHTFRSVLMLMSDKIRRKRNSGGFPRG